MFFSTQPAGTGGGSGIRPTVYSADTFSPPESPELGDLWFRTDPYVFRYMEAPETVWTEVAVSPAPPTGPGFVLAFPEDPEEGDFALVYEPETQWFETVAAYRYDGSDWVAIATIGDESIALSYSSLPVYNAIGSYQVRVTFSEAWTIYEATDENLTNQWILAGYLPPGETVVYDANLSPQDGDVLTYYSETGAWGAGAPSGGGGTSNEVRSDYVDPYSYIGVAPAGSAEGDAVWTITRIDITDPNNPLVVTATAWDDRLTIGES
jgi:hypothetical protein